MTSERTLLRAERFRRFAQAASVSPDSPFAQAQWEKVRDQPIFKEMSKRALALANAYRANGINSYIDNCIRLFLAEYNNRVFKARGLMQPISFNVMKTFIEPDENAFSFNLLPEHLHGFALTQYLDHITSPVYIDDWASLDALSELEIYEYNQLGSPAKIELPGLGDMLFGGIGLVRNSTEISICALFGEPNNEEPREISEIDGRVTYPGKEFLHEGRKVEDLNPEPFFGDASYSPLIILLQIDLETKKRESLYLLRERIDGFFILHDDAALWEEARQMSPDRFQEIKQASDDGLAVYADVIELTFQLTGLPEYFDSSEDDVRIERHPTRLRTEKLPLRIKAQIENLEKTYRPMYREVLTVSTQPLNRDVAVNLKRSGLQRETSGYWKSLNEDHLGADKHSNTIHGKTWVTKDLTWMESPILERAGDLKMDVADIGIGSTAPGYVYTMRSAAHPRDVFKIGMTTKPTDERAEQLSSGSGQPDKMLVVEDWHVNQPATVEKLIHESLDNYRINQAREFFKIKYKDLRATVERIAAPFLIE